MSSRSKEQQNKKPNHGKVFSGFALSLVLIPAICPWVNALESTESHNSDYTSAGNNQDRSPAKPSTAGGAGAPASKSALDLQLDKYQKALDNKTLSEGDLQKLAELATQNPTNARVHLLFGGAYDLLGLADEAVEQYKLADQYGPKDPEAIAAILHDTIARGGGEGANTLLNSAIKRFPDNAKILYLIGKRLKENGHWGEAATTLVHAYKISPKVPGLPSALGDLMVNQNPRRAVLLAKEDLAVNPDFAPGLLVLSKGLMLMDNYLQAQAPLQKLYEQAPSNQESSEMYLRCLYWCGAYNKALEPAFYCLRNDSQYVVPELRSATTLSDVLTHVPADYAAGALQSFYEKTDKAKLQISPPFHFFVGRIFFRLHRLPEAKAELLRYLDSDPKSAEALWMLGNIADNCDHDNAAALKYYRLAHAIWPYHAGIAGACLGLEERMTDLHNDWARCLRDWLYSIFSWGKH